MPGRPAVIVVGGGAAGCVVAARLSADPRLSVVLLEAGPGGAPTAAQRSPAFFDAIAEPGRTWDGLAVRRTDAQPPMPYVAGRGIGGSSAINGMFATIAPPSDYDAWQSDHGCTGWGWASVGPVFDGLPLPIRAVPAIELGPVGGALVAAGGRPAPLMIHASGERAAPADVYLGAASGRPNLTIRTGTRARRILVEGADAVGVELDGGEVVEAGTVVVCAGALATPRLLLHSGVGPSGVGRGLMDHPAVPLTMRLRSPDPRARASTATLDLRDRDEPGAAQVLALNTLGTSAENAAFGQLVVALMRVRSEGTVDIDGASIRALSDERERTSMRAAVRRTVTLASEPPLALVADAVTCDAAGTPAAALLDLDDDALDRWLLDNASTYFHVASSCRMGPATNERAVVGLDGRVRGCGRLWLCDASVLPSLPAAGPALTVVMVAERIAAAIAAELA